MLKKLIHIAVPFHEQIQPDSEVIALDELYNKQNHILSNNNSDGYLLTGTQLLDFCKYLLFIVDLLILHFLCSSEWFIC